MISFIVNFAILGLIFALISGFDVPNTSARRPKDDPKRPRRLYPTQSDIEAPYEHHDPYR